MLSPSPPPPAPNLTLRGKQPFMAFQRKSFLPLARIAAPSRCITSDTGEKEEYTRSYKYGVVTRKSNMEYGKEDIAAVLTTFSLWRLSPPFTNIYSLDDEDDGEKAVYTRASYVSPNDAQTSGGLRISLQMHPARAPSHAIKSKVNGKKGKEEGGEKVPLAFIPSERKSQSPQSHLCNLVSRLGLR